MLFLFKQRGKEIEELNEYVKKLEDKVTNLSAKLSTREIEIKENNEQIRSLINTLSSLESNFKIFDIVVKEAIKNETGEGSKIQEPYISKLAMANHFKAFNDINMDYISEILENTDK